MVHIHMVLMYYAWTRVFIRLPLFVNKVRTINLFLFICVSGPGRNIRYLKPKLSAVMSFVVFVKETFQKDANLMDIFFIFTFCNDCLIHTLLCCLTWITVLILLVSKI